MQELLWKKLMKYAMSTTIIFGYMSLVVPKYITIVLL